MESHGTHWKRKGDETHAVVRKFVRLRWPCPCPHGERWQAAREPFPKVSEHYPG